MYKSKCFPYLLALLFALFTLTSGSAVAASACKGKSQSSCEAASDCSWIKGYKKKDGSKVSAYCRAKPGKSSGSSKKASSKSASSSDDKKKSDKKSDASSDNKKSDKKSSSSSSDSSAS